MRGIEVAERKIAGYSGLCKFIVTSACERRCPYCLSKHMDIPEAIHREQTLFDVLMYMSAKYPGIMLSGGEPTIAKEFEKKLYMSKALFKFVALTTGNEFFLGSPTARLFDEIVLSLHCGVWETPEVPTGMIVYASILDFQYTEQVPWRLRELGYAGLTVSEDKFGKERFDEGLLVTHALAASTDFSMKLNRRDYCVADREFIMPDLTVINDYGKFLEE